MSVEIVFEIIYTVAAFVVTLIGMLKYFRQKKPLFIQMVVCMVGCRFFNGFLDLLLVKSKMNMETFRVSSLVQLAQFLFLICASIGALDSLCDDGSKSNRKYRIIAAFIPVAIYAGLILFAIYDEFNTAEMLMMLIPVLVPLYSLYFHIKHLIIPDVEDGIVRSIRPYNAICILNCMAFLLEYAFEFGSVYWYVSMSIGIIVTIIILPVLAHGVKKWFE